MSIEYHFNLKVQLKQFLFPLTVLLHSKDFAVVPIVHIDAFQIVTALVTTKNLFHVALDAITTRHTIMVEMLEIHVCIMEHATFCREINKYANICMIFKKPTHTRHLEHKITILTFIQY